MDNQIIIGVQNLDSDHNLEQKEIVEFEMCHYCKMLKIS